MNARYDFNFGPVAQNDQLGFAVPGSGGTLLQNDPGNLSLMAPLDLNFGQSTEGFGGFLNKYGEGLELGLKGLGAVGGLVNSYVGIKQLQYAKDALKEGRRQFDLNFGAQRGLINSQLEDRQRARIADSGGKGDYESVSSYMDKYGVK